MMVRGITILKSAFPVVIKEKPSSRTIEAIGKLTSNRQFILTRDLMRKIYHIPEKGYDINAYVGKDDISLSKDQDEMISYSLLVSASVMRGKVDLADDFLPQLLLMFFFNAIIDLDDFKGFVTRPINFIAGKANIAAAMFNYPYEIGAILIPYAISKNKFKEWLNNNWDKIGKSMENLPHEPIGARSYKNMLIAMEIIDLRDQEKLSFPKISLKLIENYPEEEKLADEGYIKRQYFFYKDFFKRFTEAPKE